MNSNKIEEAQEHIRLAEKGLKTSFLKWRPDYELAADEYNKAANCFRLAKAYDQCKYCLLKSADCHKQARSLFHSAKCLDQAILVCREMNNLQDIRMLAERACNLYQQHGSPESGLSTLDKAAKILEQAHPELALALYQRAIDVTVVEDSCRQSTEYANKVARLLVKLGMYDQACDAIRREIGLYQESENIGLIGRLAVALVLVQLARGDQVAAEKAFKEWGNCCDPAEVQTLEMLLQAYDDEDPDAARQALSSSFIRHMDVEYARLAMQIPLPKGIAAAPKAKVVENANSSYVSPSAGADAAEESGGGGGLDDIEEGALC